jgi:hypothetical protein
MFLCCLLANSDFYCGEQEFLRNYWTSRDSAGNGAVAVCEELALKKLAAKRSLPIQRDSITSSHKFDYIELKKSFNAY